MEERPQIQN